MTGHADKYYLLSNDTGESLLLDNAPVGWDATRFNILRDAVYLGVIKTISVEFNFVGEGFDFLQRHRLLYGMDASILFRVYRKDVYLVGGKVNFENFYEDRKFNKFRIDIVQGTFHQKFTNNEDVKLNLLNNISLDRLAITPAELKSATFRGKQVLYESTFTKPAEGTEPQRYHHTVPFLVVKNGNPNVNLSNSTQFDCNPVTEDQNGEYQELQQADELMAKECSIFVNKLPATQTITIDWSLDFTSTYIGTDAEFVAYGAAFRNVGFGTYGDHVEGGFFALINKISIRLLDQNENVSATIYEQLYRSDNGPWEGVGVAPLLNPTFWGRHVLSSINTIEVPPGFSVVFTFELMAHRSLVPAESIFTCDNLFMEDNNFFPSEYVYNELSLLITEESVLQDTQHDVILPHEIFQTLISQINGGRFISNYFGRTELGYYEDGEGAYIAITVGEILRGIESSTLQINTSFRDAFKSYNAIRCLGAIIGEDYIRIEPLDDLFNYEIAADIGEVREFAITPAKDFLFNSIKAGFPNNEYEQENGRDEFNTTYQYTNGFQSVKRELDLVSVYNGDGYGIEFARRANITVTGTADSRYDGKIFLICCKLDELGSIVTKRDEDVLSVSGIFSPTTAYNLDIAVGQNMLRWKRYLNIPLYRKSERKLFFQGKDKEASMQLVTDLGISNDGEDISLGGSYYFLPEERRFQCPIHIDVLFDILANPLGLVKYTYKDETFYDLIYELDSEVEKAATQWRVLGTKASPVEEVEEDNYITGPILKYGSRLVDYVKYGVNDEDFVLYSGDAQEEDDSIPLGQLIYRGFAPTVSITGALVMLPSVGVMTYTGFAPSVFGAGGLGEMLFTGYAPTITIGGEGLGTLGGDFLQTLDDDYILPQP